MKKICAIYTRKSSEERLDMEFNSLDAQREGCEAYILSQKSEGWIASAAEYDDGGFSGGTLERPALNRLLDDIKAGKIHIVVVYKIDRLTRSLMDFSKLVEVFDEYGVTFVSITQSFNTTTSMGRLTLNVLLSFAQFEREVTGERIRDKIAASKRKGMWMGGTPPIGYRIQDRQLVVDEEEAPIARMIFERYVALGCVRTLKHELDASKIYTPVRISKKKTKYGGRNFSRGNLHEILKNPAYIGKIRHKHLIYEGLHDGIIDSEIWQKAQDIRSGNNIRRTVAMQERNILQGLLFDPDGVIYSPTFTKRHNRHYRYYISQNLLQYRDHPKGVLGRVPAHEIETFVDNTLRDQLLAIWPGEDENTIRNYFLQHHRAISSHDFIRTLVKKITLDLGHVTITLNSSGLSKLASKHMNLKITPESLNTGSITVPYKAEKAQRGAIVMKPPGQTKDILDLPSDKLKKLVQGIVWRDEHFDGISLKEIAMREQRSEGYIGKVILESFKTLQGAV